VVSQTIEEADDWYNNNRNHNYNKEENKMITAEFTHEEVQSLIQSLEAERDQYLKDFGSNRFSFVRDISERVVKQNNQLIQKLESMIEGRVPS
jgi:hypothetical protein